MPRLVADLALLRRFGLKQKQVPSLLAAQLQVRRGEDENVRLLSYLDVVVLKCP